MFVQYTTLREEAHRNPSGIDACRAQILKEIFETHG